MAEQLAQGEKMHGGLETELEGRTRPPLTRAQALTPVQAAPQPASEKTTQLPEELSVEIGRQVRSMVAQALSTARGPNVICFIPKDRRPKWIAYPVVPEAEANEFSTVLVFQCATTNVEVRGRNLKLLAIAYSIGRLETVRVSDGDFATGEAYVTDILFHPPEPGRLSWSEKGEYVPQAPEEPQNVG